MSRDAILAKIRKSLGNPADDSGRRDAVERRIAAPPRATAPSRVAATGNALVDIFVDELRRQVAEVEEVATADDIPTVIARYLKAKNQPPRIRLGSDEKLAGLDFAKSSGMEADKGPATADDTAGLSMAYLAMAETGTMALLSGPGNPVTLAFLPETHVIVVPKSRIVATYEDAFALLRKEKGAGAMPRTLNLITGPSRTADIGGRIVIGAHGPRRLLAIVAADL